MRRFAAHPTAAVRSNAASRAPRHLSTTSLFAPDRRIAKLRRSSARSKGAGPSPIAAAMKAKPRETSGNTSRGYPMAEATPRLYIPALGGLYNATRDFAEPILRIVLGAVLIPHGCQ